MVADSLAKLYFVSSSSELWDSTIPDFILPHIVNNMSIVSGIKFRCSLFCVYFSAHVLLFQSSKDAYRIQNRVKVSSKCSISK